MGAREDALLLFPIGTPVGRELADGGGRLKTFGGKVCDFCDLYGRVEYLDGDWEELARRERIRRIGVAARPASSPAEDRPRA